MPEEDTIDIQHGRMELKFSVLSTLPIAVTARSKARTVFARSNTEIVGSNPTGGMDVCVFCVRFFCVYIVSGETASRHKKRLMRTYHWISPFMSYIQSTN
jgi:hypothetical protein